jgi:uncharacterized protein (DUF1499 family)
MCFRIAPVRGYFFSIDIVRRVLAITAILIGMISCKREVHQNIGLKDGVLKPCPNMPNCIGSMHKDDTEHYNQAWKYQTTKSKAIQALLIILESNGKASIISSSENYIHAEYTISLFGFVDDVEFYFPDTGLIHYRSASRVGYWDVGANKSRLKKIKNKLKEKGVLVD